VHHCCVAECRRLLLLLCHGCCPGIGVCCVGCGMLIAWSWPEQNQQRSGRHQGTLGSGWTRRQSNSSNSNSSARQQQLVRLHQQWPGGTGIGRSRVLAGNMIVSTRISALHLRASAQTRVSDSACVLKRVVFCFWCPASAGRCVSRLFMLHIYLIRH